MIRTYEAGELSSGWVGTRVAVSVNGKLKQRYFSRNIYSKESALEQAKVLEAEWLLKQVKFAKDRVFSTNSNTGIAGLRLSYDTTTRNNNTYVYKAIRYQSYLRGKYKIQCWFIQDEVPNDVWFDICNTIRNFRGLTNAMFDKLILKKPLAINLAKIYDKMLGDIETRKIDKADQDRLTTKMQLLEANFS